MQLDIIYSKKLIDICGNRLSMELIKEAFEEAKLINKRLISNNLKIAYFFIDPLINSFEAANNFYFNVIECESISRINTYKSGASPIQALCDAKELIDNNLYDAVFIFGQELLLSNMKNYRNEVKKAMNIFEEKTLIQCYNELAEQLCREVGLTEDQFFKISDLLYDNYTKSYNQNTGSNSVSERGRVLDNMNAHLFKLTDCANPNIDFVGGIVVSNTNAAEFLGIDRENKTLVSSCKYNVVKGDPNSLNRIIGNKGEIFPHLKEAFKAAQEESKIDVSTEYSVGNLLLEVYTCYPPIPIAFLLSTEIIKDISELEKFIKENQMTVSGGLNLARAPWNNPALSGLIDLCEKMKKDKIKYGVVHGNGGIGEIQGVAILERYEGR